jgi:hypothetical protein
MGDRLYVFGGNNDTGAVSTVEVAVIGSDNTLGAFSLVPGALDRTLTRSRHYLQTRDRGLLLRRAL